MGRHRREFGTCRQQGGEVEDQFDAELRQHALEQTAIEDRAGDLPIHFAGNRGIQTAHVERDNRALPLLGEPRDQSVTNLAAGAGDEHDRFAHARIILTDLPW
jgi:hypothetical protein